MSGVPVIWHGCFNVYNMPMERLQPFEFLVHLVPASHLIKCATTGASKENCFASFCEQGLLEAVKLCHEVKYINLQECADQAFLAGLRWGQPKTTKWLLETCPEKVQPLLKDDKTLSQYETLQKDDLNEQNNGVLPLKPQFTIVL